jgi:lipoprotein-anchoring transpeptidase ErfK/SrfK
MSFSKYVLIIAAFAATGVLSACQQPVNGNLNQPIANTVINSTNSTPQADTRKTEPIAGAPFTMAILDAVFADEALTRDARTAAQLTDEEVDKLRIRARSAVSELSGDPTEDESRSTASATSIAVSEVKKILGDDRGNKLIAFVQKRWTGEGPDAAAKPNSVPSDTRVVVNIPAYRMDIFTEGQLVKSYKIGIGYPEFPLPTGLRKAEKIIFNPTWTPPDEAWVKGKVSPGKTVEAGDKLNPLGPIKIPIGLPSLIHGGKSAARIGTFASHGCVGLTNAQVQDVAIELSKLAGKPLTMEEIKGYEKAKSETKEVGLGKEIQVELRYETIVVENGVLKIFRDVYERGTNTQENLRRVLSQYGVEFDSLDAATKEKLSRAVQDMAVDALGKPVDTTANSNTSSASNAISNSKANANSSGNVTKNIKGKKEIAVPIPQLAGKGYPAPVNLKSS